MSDSYRPPPGRPDPGRNYRGPPPPSRYHQQGGYDSYVPARSRDYDPRDYQPRDYHPPDRADTYRPMERRPPSPRPLSDVYTFGARNDRHQSDAFNDGYDSRHSFRPINAPRGPTFDSRIDFDDRSDRNLSKRRNPPTGPRRDQRRDFNQRPRFQPVRVHDRPILRTVRESTPEQLLGMSDQPARFLAADDLSESDASMEVDSDYEGDNGVTLAQEATDSDGVDGPPAKRRAVNGDESVSARSAPRWSNPDPYTVLPPPDESQSKKKDVVKLIRKAKIAAEAKAANGNAVTKNADFISFDFGDDQKDESLSNSEADVPPGASASVTDGVPKFSHLDHLHGDRSVSAGAVQMQPLSASELGPPPGLIDTYRVTDAANASPPPPPPSTALPPLPPLPSGPAPTNDDVWPPPDTETAVRGKKRGREDDTSVQPTRSQNKKRRVGNGFDGSILVEWLPPRGGSATPWLTVDHSRTATMGLWLHKEICDFYEYAKPRGFEVDIRKKLITRVQNAFRRRHPKSRIEVFGSFAAGLFLPTADMDLVLLGSRILDSRLKKEMYALASDLTHAGLAQGGSVQVVHSAKVPIIKFVDSFTGINVDISFENTTGVVANATFQKWKKQYPAMPVLVTLIKQYLAMRGMNEVFSGGIGGFTVTCLVTSMLQHMPALQSGNMRQEHNYGELLLNFLDLYGNKFNILQTALSLDPPAYIPKNANLRNMVKHRPDRLTIIDPNRADNDISGGSSKIDSVLSSFSDAYDTLQDRMAQLQRLPVDERGHMSILESVLGGNYASFEEQRGRLKHSKR